MACDKFSLFSLNTLTNAELQTLQIVVYNVNVSIELILKFEYDGQVNHLVSIVGHHIPAITFKI